MATRTAFDLKTVQAVAERPFYATVGVTDLAVEAVREYVTDVQSRVLGFGKDVQKNVTSVDLQPKVLRDTAVTVVSERVEALQKDAQARRTAFERRVAELQGEAKAVPSRVQSLVDENVTALEGAYGDLIKRGESLVGRIRRQQSTQDTVKAAETTVAKAKTTRTQATKATKATRTTAKKATGTAKKQSATSRGSAKATVTAAKKTASSAARAAAEAAEKVGD
jgi:membrane protein involved in colicin uptake